MIMAICSGKGGVGKTTLCVNLAVGLARFGSVLVVDSDIALPNLHTFFGLDDPFISLLDALKDPAYLRDAIHQLRVGKEAHDLHVLPASTSVKALEEVNIENLREILKKLKDEYDFIVVDVAAGLSKYAMVPMMSSDVVYLIVNPEKASIFDSQKVRKVADISGIDVGGIVMNRYRGEKKMVEYAESVIGVEIVGIVRDSGLIRECWEEGIPVTIKKKRSKVARDFINLARKIVGEQVEVKPYGRLKFLLG
jgi:septum site-determining protein MinD